MTKRTEPPQPLEGGELDQASGGLFWMPEGGIRGGDGVDIMDGSDLSTMMRGMGGNDTLIGRGGDDTLQGGDGADSLSGGVDDDWLNGGSGRDSLLGGAGADYLGGGDGDDLFIVASDGGVDTVSGSEGHDTIWIAAEGIHAGNVGISITSGDPGTLVMHADGSLGVAGLSGTITFTNPDGSQGSIDFSEVEKVRFD